MVMKTNPKITQKQMSKQVGIPDSAIKSYRYDINMNSPYNRSNRQRKEPPNILSDPIQC